MAEGQEQPRRGPEADLPDVRSGADLRCSDVDRERVAEALRQAATDGRLTLTELDERIDATFQARTYGDLQPITRDLPQGPYPVPGAAPAPQWQPDTTAGAAGAASPNGSGAPARHQTPVPDGPPPPPERITGILSTEKRKGRWEVPARLDLTTVLGEIVIDLTDAVVRSPEVEIQVGVVLGSVTLIAPEGADVRLEHGANVLGERKMRLRSAAVQGGPVYRVRGFVVLGEVVVRAPRR
ncbi:cell wall-active antibiotic response 4TMS protein YvqF [Haloactinopolyspora alba]|uniref:Cell wall-active antibiotic response 4TMS protein YvqF n=1 Tax=Haloactinopolyspora alba TaxID=648780 RepID=A0A2P8DX22_9ACTN|nr:DUF1707 domain-containing protein [Haloactinopolyspora alba]PSL01770.1 cell wall-active antibiotic response 4TMS protein YvqF [Haloactinopolyspora alba]